MSFQMIEIVQCYIFIVKTVDPEIIHMFHADNDQLLELEEFFDHGLPVERMVAFTNHLCEPMLISFSEGILKLWNVDLAKYNFNHGLCYKGLEIPFIFNNYSRFTITYFDNKNLLIGSWKKDLIVYEILGEGEEQSLHKYNLIKSEFLLLPETIINCDHMLIVSLCADQSAVVIKYPSMELVYRTGILSLNTLTSLCIQQNSEHLIIGTGSGEVLFYDISYSGFIKEVYRIKLFESKLFFSSNNSCSEIKQRNNNEAPLKWQIDFQNINLAQSEESKCGVVDIIILKEPRELRNINNVLKYLGDEAVKLIIVSTLSGIFIINSFEVVIFIVWNTLFNNPNNNTMRCTIKNLKKHLLFHEIQSSNVFLINFNSILNRNIFTVEEVRSINASDSLCQNSVLHKTLTLPKVKLSNGKDDKIKIKKAKSLNKALTFQTKIKSSGYSIQEPKRKFFQPLINKNSIKKEKNSFMMNMKSDYPPNEITEINLVKETKLDSESVNIHRINSSNYGELLACCSSTGGCHIVDSKNHGNKQFAQISKSALTQCQWSLEDKLLLLTDNRSLNMWSIPQSRILLSINNPSNELNNILDGQFYLMDRFFHYTCGSKFRLMNYVLDEEKDLFKYKNESKYNCVYEWQSSTVSTITASSTVNQFYSYMLLIASTDYKLSILDLNIMTTVEEKTQCHDRKIERITINKGSLFAETSAANNHCFATSADTGLKLWDIRLKMCTQFYPKTIISSRYSNSVEFTPCGNYICAIVGDSIDFYDIRVNKLVCSSRSPNNSYSDFSCSPKRKMIYSATNNGSIQSYLLN